MEQNAFSNSDYPLTEVVYMLEMTNESDSQQTPPNTKGGFLRSLKVFAFKTPFQGSIKDTTNS